MPAADAEQLPGELRIGIDDVGRILGAAALEGDEGAFEVDSREFALIGELGEKRRTLPEDIAGGSDERGDQGGGPVPAVLEDGGHRLLARPRVREGGPAPAVAVDVDEAGEDRRPLGGGRSEGLLLTGALRPRGVDDPSDDAVLGDDDTVFDDPISRHDSSANLHH